MTVGGKAKDNDVTAQPSTSFTKSLVFFLWCDSLIEKLETNNNNNKNLVKKLKGISESFKILSVSSLADPEELKGGA